MTRLTVFAVILVALCMATPAQAGAAGLDRDSEQFDRLVDKYSSAYGSPVTERSYWGGGGAILFPKGVVLPYGNATDQVWSQNSIGNWAFHGFDDNLSNREVGEARNRGVNDDDIDLVQRSIGDTPASTWLGGWYSPETTTSVVANKIDEASSHDSHALFTVYNIPFRDCGGASSGGAGGWDEYIEYARAIARGSENRPGALLVIEPDALGFMTKSACDISEHKASMLSLLRESIATYKNANSDVRVYVSASTWGDSYEQAEMLDSLGADGFALGVSGDESQDALVDFGEEISEMTGGLPYITEAGRDGNGTRGKPFDDPERALGVASPMARGPHHAGSLVIKPVTSRDSDYPYIEGCESVAGAPCIPLAADLARNASDRRAVDFEFTDSGVEIYFDNGDSLSTHIG